MNIQFRQSHNTNFRVGRTSRISYIVLHYTANNGDTAKNNADYFANNANLSASAHYFVDERDTVYNTVRVEDTAWHCGGGRQGSNGSTFFGRCTNSNSIGIEMCSRKDSSGRYFIKPETVQNAINLTKQLMVRFNVPAANVIRHFDVTGKVCPEPFVRDSAQWAVFKNEIVKKEEGLTMSQYEELKREIEAIKGRVMPKWGWIDNNLPDWAKPTIQKLVSKDILKGDDTGNLRLTEDLLRVLVINDRAGLYG